MTRHRPQKLRDLINYGIYLVHVSKNAPQSTSECTNQPLRFDIRYTAEAATLLWLQLLIIFAVRSIIEVDNPG